MSPKDGCVSDTIRSSTLGFHLNATNIFKSFVMQGSHELENLLTPIKFIWFVFSYYWTCKFHIKFLIDGSCNVVTGHWWWNLLAWQHYMSEKLKLKNGIRSNYSPFQLPGERRGIRSRRSELRFQRRHSRKEQHLRDQGFREHHVRDGEETQGKEGQGRGCRRGESFSEQ